MDVNENSTEGGKKQRLTFPMLAAITELIRGVKKYWMDQD